MNPTQGSHPPPPPRTAAGPPPMRNDAEQLRLLAMFHFIYAGLIALFGLVGAAFLAFGVFAAANARPTAQTPNPEVAGIVVAVLGTVVMLFVFGVAFLSYLTGRFLKQRRHRTFCIVMSAIHCASFPLGTALGVFTIIVLARDSVVAMFEQSERAAQMPPPGVPPFHSPSGA